MKVLGALISLRRAVWLTVLTTAFAITPARALRGPPDQAVLTADEAVIEASGGRAYAFKTMVGMKIGAGRYGSRHY